MARKKKAAPPKYSLGEEGSEQFEVRAYVDGAEVSRQNIHDPFITTTVHFRRWRLLKSLLAGHTKHLRVTVQVRGSRGAESRIMQLDPFELMRETEALEGWRSEPMALDCKEK